MKMSVVVPTLNRPSELATLLSALVDQSRTPDEVVVVDASRPAPPPPRGLPFPLIRLLERPNASRQRNAGALAASGDAVVFLDDDVVPERDFLRHIEGSFLNHPSCVGGMGTLAPMMHRRSLGVLVSRLFMLQHEHGDGGFYLSGFARLPHGSVGIQTTRVLSGGVMAVRRRVLENGGTLFDEEMPHSLEDAEFSWRLSTTGELFFNPMAIVRHVPSDVGRPNEAEAARRFMAGYRRMYWHTVFPSSPGSLPAHFWALLGLFLIAAARGRMTVLRGYMAAWTTKG